MSYSTCQMRLSASYWHDPHLRHVSDQQALRQRVAHVAADKGRDKLAHCKAVVGTQRVQQRHGMELHHGVLALNRLADLVRPALHNLHVVNQQVRPAHQHLQRTRATVDF
jgi:hypothetical protein